MADKDGFLNVGLGDQQPIKRVPVICRQSLQCQNVLESDRQQLDIVGLLLAIGQSIEAAVRTWKFTAAAP